MSKLIWEFVLAIGELIGVILALVLLIISIVQQIGGDTASASHSLLWVIAITVLSIRSNMVTRR